MRLKQSLLIVTVLVTMGISAQAFMPGMPIEAKSDSSFAATSMDVLQQALMMIAQKDEVAFTKFMAKGVMDGQIKICAPQEKVFFMGDVDKNFIKIRPAGETETYFALKQMFQWEGGNSKK